MSKLGLKKLLVAIIAVVFTFATGITLATALYRARGDNSPMAVSVPDNVPADAISIKNFIAELQTSADKSWTDEYSLHNNFYIEDKTDLINFREFINHGILVYNSVWDGNYTVKIDFENKNIYLTNDIDLIGEKWIPIGNSRNISRFSLFEGNGHTISNVDIDCKYLADETDVAGTGSLYRDTDLGFFGRLYNESGITIQNLRLDDVQIYGDPENVVWSTNNTTMGCLVGTVGAQINIYNCCILNGSIKKEFANDGTGIDYAVSACAGLVGAISGNSGGGFYVNGCIKNCSVDVDIEDKQNYDTLLGPLDWTQYAGIANFVVTDNGDINKFEFTNSVFMGNITDPYDNGNSTIFGHFPHTGDIFTIYNANGTEMYTGGVTVSNCYAIGSYNNAAYNNWYNNYFKLDSDYKYDYNTFSNFTPQQRLNWFKFDAKYNSKTNAGDSNKESMYIPRTNEFDNGIPISTIFLDMSKMFTQLQVVIEGEGSLTISDISNNDEQTLSSSSMSKFWIPYDIRGNNYSTNFNNNISSTTTGFYGYDLSAEAATGWVFEKFWLEPYTSTATKNEPYVIHVRFVRPEDRHRNVKVYFGGFLIVDGAIDGGVDSVQGTAIVRSADCWLDKYDPSVDGREYTIGGEAKGSYVDDRGVTFDADDPADYSGKYGFSRNASSIWVEDNYLKVKTTNSTEEDYYYIRHSSQLSLKLAFTSVQCNVEELTDDDFGDGIYAPHKDGSVIKDGDQLTVNFGLHNNGYDEVVYLWALLETEEVTITTKSTSENELQRIVANIKLKDGVASNLIKLENGELKLKVLTGGNNNLQTTNGNSNIYLNFNLAFNQEFFEGIDGLFRKKSILQIYGSKFKNYFYIPDAAISDENSSTSFTIGEVRNSVESFAGNNIFYIVQNTGYEYYRITSVEKLHTIYFTPIEFSFYLYKQKANVTSGSLFNSLEQSYNVEAGYSFYNKVLNFAGEQVSTDFWGLLLNQDEWAKYGYTLSGPSEKSFGSKRCLVYTLQQQGGLYSIYVAVEYATVGGAPVVAAVRQSYYIDGVAYSYAKIEDVALSYGGGGIIQFKNSTGDDEIFSMGNIASMSEVEGYAPTFLAISEEETIDVNLKNVEYVINGQTKNYSADNTARQYSIGYGGMTAYTFNQAGEGYAYKTNLIGDKSLRIDEKGFQIANELYRFYALSLNGELLYSGDAIADLQKIYDINLTIKSNEGLKTYSLKNGGTASLKAGRSYDLCITLTLKTIGLNFNSLTLQTNETWVAETNLFVGETTNSLADAATVNGTYNIAIGSTLSFVGSEYVNSSERADNLIYKVKITLPATLFNALNVTGNDYNYMLIFAPYATTAAAYNGVEDNYKSIYVINKGGFKFAENRIGYSSALLQTYEVFPTSISSADVVVDDQFEENLYIFVGQQTNNSIPLYYIKQAADKNYSAYTLNFNSNSDYNVAEIINLLELGNNYSNDTWGITSNKDVLLMAGFTHISAGALKQSASGQISSISSLTQLQLDGIFNENENVTLLKSTNSDNFTFANNFDYERFIFEIGDVINDSTSVGNLSYFKISKICAGSFGNLAVGTISYGGKPAKSTLSIEEDDPFIKLLYSTYTLQFNIGEFVYDGNVYKIDDDKNVILQYDMNTLPSNAIHGEITTMPEIGSYQFLNPVKGENYFIYIPNILKGQELQFSLQLISMLEISLKLNAVIPVPNEKGVDGIYTANNYYAAAEYVISDAKTGEVLRRIDACPQSTLHDSYIFGEDGPQHSNIAITVQLTPKKLNFNSTTKNTAYVGETLYKENKNYVTDISKTIFVGTSFEIKKLSSAVEYSNSTNETLNYYSLTATIPDYLLALKNKNIVSDFAIYVLPRLVTKVDDINLNLQNYFVYPAHGYKLNTSSSPFAGLSNKFEASKDVSTEINYALINYTIPVYYSTQEENYSSLSIPAEGYSINSETFALPEKESLLTGLSALENYNWAITSNLGVLLKQGFTHILFNGEIQQLTQDVLNNAFSNAFNGTKQIVLFKQAYPTITNIINADYEYDYEKIIFNLSSKAPTIWGGETAQADYYYLDSVEQGSYLGGLQTLTLSTKNLEDVLSFPYIQLIYKPFVLNLHTGMFEFENTQVFNTAEQQFGTYGYPSTQREGDCIIYSNSQIMANQTLQFSKSENDECYLSIIDGFNLLMYLPSPEGNLTKLAQIAIYYSQLRIVINDTDLILNLDEDFVSKTYTITEDVSVRLIATPRVINQVFISTLDGETASINGGAYGFNLNDIFALRLLRLTSFVGGTRTIKTTPKTLTLNGKEQVLNTYSFEIELPTYLAELANKVAIETNYATLLKFKIQIVPVLSLADNSFDIYIVPDHGYSLTDNPISHMANGAFENLTDSQTQLISSENYAINFKLNEYSIPLYYRDANNAKFYNYYEFGYNVQTNSIQFPLANEEIDEMYENWALISNIAELTAQGFDYVLNEGEIIVPLSTFEPNALESLYKSGSVTLFRSKNLTNAYDYDKFTFTLKGGNSVEGFLQDASVHYYVVYGLQASFGGITANSEFELTKFPYIQAIYASYTLRIFTGEFKYQSATVAITSSENKQYGIQTEEGINWLPIVNNVVYSATNVVSKQTLSFNGETSILSLGSPESAFSLLVAVPAANTDGYVLVGSGEVDKFYEDVSWFYRQAGEWIKVDANALDLIALNQNTDLKIVFTPKKLVSTINVGSLQNGEYAIGAGGRVSLVANQVADNDANKQMLNLFVGSVAKVEKLEENMFVLSVDAPAYLKNLIAIAGEEFEYLIYIVSNVSDSVPDNISQKFKTYFYPMHGYQLEIDAENENASPIKLGDTSSLTNLDSNSSLAINSDIDFLICYELKEYSIPVYFAEGNSANYSFIDVPFNVTSQDVNFATLHSSTQSWLISTNLTDLTYQGFTHILIDGAPKLLNDQNLVLNAFKNKTITLFNSNNKVNEYDYDMWTFELGDALQTEYGTYYFVTKLLANSYGSLEGKTNISISLTASVGPYIRAFIPKNYNLTISNLAFDSEKMQQTTIHYQDVENLPTYFGVGASNLFVQENNLAENEFGVGYNLKTTINSSNKFNFAFFNTNLNGNHAFYLKNNFAEDLTSVSNADVNYWFVYNYGYEIVAWKVILNFNSSYIDLNLSASKWEEINHVLGGKELSVAQLNNIYLSSIAKYLDEKYAISPINPEIILIPVWQAVSIMPTNNSSNLSNAPFKYGETYNLFNYKSYLTPMGQSLIYFETATNAENSKIIINPKNENGILQSVYWNYRQLTSADYAYSNGRYIIELTPVFVDNIYQISLNANEIKAFKNNGTNNYILNSNNYSFAQMDYTNSVYEFDNKDLYKNADFSFTSFNEYKSTVEYLWADSYALNLGEFKTKYNDAISQDGAKLEILTKIYADGNVKIDELEYNSATYPSLSGDVKAMYIYLANNQQVNRLPAFITDYYELILWHNVGSLGGQEIDYGYTTERYIDAEYNQDVLSNGISLLDNWRYSQTLKNGENDASLHPYYFRKYYYLNPKTVLAETNQVGEYGYVLIQSTDLSEENLSNNYLAICLDNKMQFYALGTLASWDSVLKYVNSEATPGTAELINLTPAENIKIYAGCALSFKVFDQSKDESAMASGLFDQMIGYKLDSLIWWSKDGYQHYSSNVNDIYNNEISKNLIDSFNLATAEVCNINIVFSKIEFTFGIKLADQLSGSFSYVNNNNLSYNAVTELSNLKIKVGEVNLINYSASAGYEFAENAFVLVVDQKEIVLATYSNLKSNGRINQSYTIVFTGQWLRENFYGQGVKNGYAVDNNNLGEIQINTTKIQFDLALKVYDSSTTANPELETINLGKWAGEDVSIENIFKETVNNSYGYIYDKRQYATISCYPYVADNIAQRDEKLTVYFDFMLKSRPANLINLKSSLTENLGVTPGIIVPENNRIVYLVLEVRPMLYIDVAISMAEYDTNSTERKVVIQNQNTEQINALQLQLSANNEHITKYGKEYYVLQGETRLYTFYNQENTISLEQLSFNINRYQGVNYNLNGNDLTENRFTVTENSILELTFVPKLLNINVDYQLEGNATTKESLTEQGILTAFNIVAEESLHINSQIEISFEIGAGYLIDISRNGVSCTIQNNSTAFAVRDSDYDFNSINIVVNLFKKPARGVFVKLQLWDNNQQTNNDAFGGFTIFVNGQQNSSADVSVSANDSVDVLLDLASGYSYAGRVNVCGVIKNLPIENNLINIVEAFRVETQNNVQLFPDAGEYVVYIQKENITLEFTNQAGQGRYTIFNNSKNCVKNESGNVVTINNAYVGSEITFNAVNLVDNYELDYYYYLDKNNNQIKISSAYLAITSNLLDDCCENNYFHIKLGVVNKRKYQVNLNVQSATGNLQDNLRFTTNLTDFVSGKYYSSGTAAEFSFFGSVLGKYDVTLTLNGNTINRNDAEFGFGHTNCNFVLNKDVTIDVYIEQTSFNINVSEYHYNTLSDLQNPDSALVDESNFFNRLSKNSRFNQQSRLEIAIDSNNYLLTKVEIKLDPSNVLTVEIVEGNLIVKFNGQLLLGDADGFYNVLVGEEIFTYSLTISNGNLVVNYTTIQEQTIDIHYINLKEIAPQS